MNKFIFKAIFLLIFILAKTQTNTQIISVGSMVFTPANASVTVGDTIKWVWAERFHTTTSTTVPAGALTWDAPIDSTHPSFIYVVAVAGQYNYRCNFHYLMGMVGTFNASPIGIINITGNTPEKFELYQNYPNPFNPTTNIEFDITEDGFVSLKVFDVIGREIESLVHENLHRGTYRVNWSGAGITSGVYFYTLKTQSFSDTKRMMLIK